MIAGKLVPPEPGVGSFHVHRGHAFEGFEVRGRELVALCTCGSTLDVADAVFARCPACAGAGDCLRCAGTGAVVDHAALAWRLPLTS